MSEDTSNPSFFAPASPDPPTPASDCSPPFGDAEVELPQCRASHARQIRDQPFRAPRRIRKRRCCACGYILQRLDAWHCPRCQSDLREVGYYRSQGWGKTIVGTFTALWRRVRRRDRPGPVCPRCDYPPRGIGGFECPECGADFHKVDIVDRDRLSPGVAVVLVCLLWIAVYIAAAKLLHVPVNRYLVPHQVSRSESIQLTAQGYRITVRGYGGDARIGMRGLPALKEIGATVLPDSDQRYAALVVQFPRGSFQIVAGVTHDIFGDGDEVIADDIGFSGRTVGELYKAAGLDIADKRVEAQAVELARMLLELSEGEMDIDAIRAFHVSSSPLIDRTGIVLWNRVEILAWFLLGLASTALVGWRLHGRLSRVDALTHGGGGA